MTVTISVITPSYNQGAFLEKTICSVLQQRCAEIVIEHLIVDGGSSDDSVSIIRRYESELAWWVSERDGGQSDAINKGLRRATGDIVCWLNSDDYFAPGALRTVARTLGPGQHMALAGHCMAVESDGSEHLLRGGYSGYLSLLSQYADYRMHQPSIFWRREVAESIGLLDESQHLIMDYDYWCRMARRYPFVNVDQVLSYCHRHPSAKTADEHEGYHRDRRLYMQKRRADLTIGERLQLAMIEVRLAPYAALKQAERSLRRRLRGAKQPGS